MQVRATVALLGEELRPSRNVCIEIEEGVIVNVGGGDSCGSKALRATVALPLASNAHLHSSDMLFPEYGVEGELRELVEPPKGLKHRLLASSPREMIVEASSRAYRLSELSGVGLIADFREPAAGGCRLGREAAKRAFGIAQIKLLGRPGDPYGMEGCDGIGLNSPLDVSPGDLEPLRGSLILSAHVSETIDARLQEDFEKALKLGVSVIVHGVHLSRSDLEYLAEEGITLVLCPRSNMWHGIGVPPVRWAIEAKARIAFGTDNASWQTPDPLEEARLALHIARLQGLRDPRAADYIIKGLYIWGYEAYGEKPAYIAEGSEARLALYTLGPEEEVTLQSARSLGIAVIKRLSGYKPSILIKGGLCMGSRFEGGCQKTL